MSLADQLVTESEKVRTHLLIQDEQYQFLPNLAALYGDTIALMLQQLFWRMTVRPWYEGEELPVEEFEGRSWVRIHNYMWFDTLEGICRHLSKSNFFLLRGKMVAAGLLLTKPSLGEEPEMIVNTNTKAEGPIWYAINVEKIQTDELRYNAAREEALTRRRAERAYVKKHNQGAHWRPRHGDDVSKPLNHCRVIFSEHQPEELAEMGIGQGLSNFRTGPNHVSTNAETDVSNFRTGAVQDLDSRESTNRTVASPDLGQAPLYNNRTALEKAKTTTAPLEITPVVTPNGVVVVESSSDNLFPVVPPRRQRVAKKTPAATQTETAQVSLPIAAPVENAGAKLPTDPAQPAVELTLRLMALADEELIELSEVDAQAIVGIWPAANYSRAALVEQLVKLKLPRSVAKEFVKANEMECRWQFQLWGRRPQTRIGHFQSEGGKARGTRIGALRSSIETAWPPENAANWIESLRADLVAQKRREQFQLDKAQANDYFESLPTPRRKRFIEDLLAARLREKAIFDVGSEAWDIVRVSMLLDPKVRAEIESWGAKPAASKPDASTEDAHLDLAPKVAARLQLYVSRLRFAIEDGDFSREQLGAKCREQGVSTAQAQWIEQEVLAALDKRQAA